MLLMENYFFFFLRMMRIDPHRAQERVQRRKTGALRGRGVRATRNEEPSSSSRWSARRHGSRSSSSEPS